MHSHRRVVRVDQAEPPQAPQCLGDGVRVYLLTTPSRQVALHGFCLKHLQRDPIGIKQRQHCQHGPGQPLRLQVVSGFDREQPGLRHRVGRGRPLLDIPPAGHPRHHGDVSRRVVQRERQVPQQRSQFRRALIWPQVVDRLRLGECPYGHQLPCRRPERGFVTPGSDHQSSTTARVRPQFRQIRRIGKVVEHHQPGPVCGGAPVEELFGAAFRIRHRSPGDHAAQFGQSGDQVRPAGRGHPPQQINLTGPPQSIGVLGGCLGFAYAAEPGQHDTACGQCFQLGHRAWLEAVHHDRHCSRVIPHAVQDTESRGRAVRPSCRDRRDRRRGARHRHGQRRHSCDFQQQRLPSCSASPPWTDQRQTPVPVLGGDSRRAEAPSSPGSSLSRRLCSPNRPPTHRRSATADRWRGRRS